MKKKKKFSFIYAFIFIILFVTCFAIYTYIFEAKESFYKNEEFLSEKQNFDVCFFGSSHAENFFDPMALWRDYGITSYNFGNPKEPIPVTYWVIENVIKINKPKIIVIDIHSFNALNDLDNYSDYIHYALDSFPLNEKKIEAINDLCDTFSDKMEKLFTVGKYHSRWKELGNDHKTDINYFIKGLLSYGHTYTMRVERFEKNHLVDDIATIDDNHKDLKYLNRLVDLCKNNDIQLIMVSTPYSIAKDSQEENINYIAKYCEEKNIPFINYNRMDSIINMHIDLYNSEHVNQSGLLKVTEHIGAYLKDNYDLTDHRNDEKYEEWNEYYNDFYLNLKYESLWSVDPLESALMLLHDPDYNAKVIIEDNSISENEQIKELVANLDQGCDIYNLSENDDKKKHTDRMMEILDENQALSFVLESHPDLSDIVAVIVSYDKSSNLNLVKLYIYDGNEVYCENVFTDIKPKYIFKE